MPRESRIRIARDRNAGVELLLNLIDQAYNKTAWHGPNLTSSLRRVDAVEARWRPQRDRHSIAEQTLHAAYWKYVVRRRIRGDKRGSFPLKGTNWFAVTGKLSEAEWKAHTQTLQEQHDQLRETVATLPASRVHRALGDTTAAALISGIAFHDVYHAGQIRLLRGLYQSRNHRGTETRRKH